MFDYKIPMRAFCTVLLSSYASHALSYEAGDALPGWMLQDAPIAHTLAVDEIEVSGNYLLVNDTVDFLDIREKMIGESALLSGDVGDLSGVSGGVNWGIESGLMLFARSSAIDLDTELGSAALFGELDSDKHLSTLSSQLGARWRIPKLNNQRLVVSLEALWQQNSSDDFVLRFNQVDAGEMMLTFSSPKEIRISGLEDSGWQARLLIDHMLSRHSFINGWIGMASYSAKSEVSTDITYAPIRTNFDRKFDIQEDQIQAGVGLNWQIRRDIPLQLFYEFRKIDREERGGDQPINSSTLAKFTNPENLAAETSNHIVTGKIGIWMTSRLNLSLTGKVMSNQFLGIVPHYNNTVTSRFFDKMYGYVGVGVSYVF